jgi:DNA repair protein RecN (Recombination protein N)
LLASGAEQSTYPKALVFDEIDAGLGGAQGAALGRKLRCLGEQFQVLAVTHLPQVACFAHRHLCVSKRVEQDRTVATVELLEGRRRQKEIARMLAAEAVTPLALEHAQELLDQAARSG